MAPLNDRILLVLDMDETLIFASESPLEREPDFRVGHYHVYRRPFLTDFLTSCHESFNVAVWSSSGANYLSAVVDAIFPAGISPVFVWDRQRCVQRCDPERLEAYFVKDLKKVKRLGFSLDRLLIVEDTPQKVERNYGNAIYVSPFYGNTNDTELIQLRAYLGSLASVPNVRSIEKRGWRFRLQTPDKE
jgi:TFIIF-interacting CTD phosphatase-like protein